MGAKRRTNLPNRIAFAAGVLRALQCWSSYKHSCALQPIIILNIGFITTLLSTSLSTCLKWKIQNTYKQMNRKHLFIVKKNYFSQMSACWCNQSNQSVNKSTRWNLFAAKITFSNVGNLRVSQWIVFVFVKVSLK